MAYLEESLSVKLQHWMARAEQNLSEKQCITWQAGLDKYGLVKEWSTAGSLYPAHGRKEDNMFTEHLVSALQMHHGSWLSLNDNFNLKTKKSSEWRPLFSYLQICFFFGSLSYILKSWLKINLF